MRLGWALIAAALLAGGCSDDPTERAGTGGPPGGATAPSVVALPDAEVVARAGAAVWRVATDGCDWIGSGSAFAVDPHHLVTNRHVIANDASPTVISPTGEERPGRVIGVSDEVDVAVIEVGGPDLPVTLPWATTDSLRPGEHIVVVGYPAPELVFTTTVGSIVNFQGRDGRREAMLTDAPIGPGNSGGPALRADATVTGVVTQMTLDDPSQRAAIVYSAASVQELVASFIAAPDDDVRSDCGFGPDYVAPLPDHFDVPAPPPPPPTTATTQPLPLPTAPSSSATTTPTTRATTTSTSRPAPPPPTSTASTTVPCPDGSPALGVESVDAEPGADDGTWTVVVHVVVVNDTGSAVELGSIDVDVGGVGDALGLDDVALGPGGTERYDIPIDDPVVAAEAPTTGDVTARLRWHWSDARNCPAAPVESNHPTGRTTGS